MPRYKLLTIVGLVFILPLLVVTYIFYINNVQLEFTHVIVLVFALLLIFAGLVIFSQIFDKIFMLASMIKNAESEDSQLVEIRKDTSELHEITISFNNLMKKFEETTEHLRLRVSELFTIKELIEIASKSLDIDYLLNVILEKAMIITGADIGSVYVVEDEVDGYHLVASQGLASEADKDPRIKVHQTLVEYVVSSKRPMLIENLNADSRIRNLIELEYESSSFLSTPIFARENLVGVLNLSHKKTEKVFDANDEQIVSILTAEIGFALENARLHSRVEENLKKLETRTAELTETNEQLQQEIADRKLAEEEKSKLEVKLEQAKRMEAIGTLAGGVAHDLNNLLSGTVSYPELLLMELPEDSPLRGPILTIKNTGDKAAAIVEDLLTLGRRGVGEFQIVNLNHLVTEYVNSPEYKKLMSFHSGVEMETDLDPNLMNLSGSAVHLSKTVMNLVSNAAEAMQEGGKLKISTENRYLDQPLGGYENVLEGDYVVLVVSDTGAGMSAEDMERIFEPFYTKKVMGKSGTGLGMAVVWGTVSDHNGYIDFVSNASEGTTFSLYFPATRKELTDLQQSPEVIENYMGKGETILIADDVEEQLEIASEIMKKLGYSVVTAASGEEAVAYLENNSVDLVILDMIMHSGIDGLETYKRILDIHPGQKAITVSGFSETKKVKEVQKLGARVYIKKPYSLDKIGMSVRAELDS